jgi:hypothetical protein
MHFAGVSREGRIVVRMAETRGRTVHGSIESPGISPDAITDGALHTHRTIDSRTTRWRAGADVAGRHSEAGPRAAGREDHVGGSAQFAACRGSSSSIHGKPFCPSVSMFPI